MPLVEVPDVGQVEFPDTMSEEEIVTAIERDLRGKEETVTEPATASKPPAPDPYNVIGEGYKRALASIEPGSFNEALKPLVPISNPFTITNPQAQQLVEMAGLEPLRAGAEGVADKIIKAVETVESPAGLLLAASAPAAPALALGVGTVLSAPSAVAGAKETVEGLREGSIGKTLAGLTETTLAAAPAIASVAKFAPASAEALRATVGEGKVGIVPEAAQKAVTRQIGESLIDQQRIKTRETPPDVLPLRDFVASPEFEFRGTPAEPLVTQGVEATLDYKSKVAHTTQRMEALRETLSEGEQATLTKALFAKEAGDATAFDKLPEPAKEAVTAIREVYDTIRGRVIEGKVASVEGELSGPQLNALRQVQDGIPLEQAAKDNGLHTAGRLIVESAKREIDELASWGVEDYTTHIERGSYRVTTPDGVTIAIAETRPEAAIKADRWLKNNPGKADHLTIDDSFNPGVEFPTKLSRGQYYRMVQRLGENLGESASEIQRILHENGSIVTVEPTKKYAGPMQRRRGILEGEENVFDVLPSYVHTMEKKLALDPVLMEAPKVLSQLPENMRKQVKTWLNDLKGQKSPGDELLDAVLGRFGGKPFTYSRSVDTLRNLAANLKLGYRPAAAVINRMSGLHHTWTKAGTRYLNEGRAWLKTAEGQAALEANKARLGVEAAFVHERLRPTSQEPLYKPLGMFQAAERSNRPEAFGAFYKYAEGELGLKGDAAVAYASKATRFSQFVYDTAALPRMMRGPTGRLLFQFKPYLLKELEFVSSLRGAEIPRYLTGFLAMGGPRAGILMLKSLPLIGAWVGFDKLEDWLNRKAPAASRGIGGAAGVDMSPSTAFQLPQQPEEFLGPVLGDMLKLAKDVIVPALQGETRDMGDVRKWAKKLAPALNYWSQLVESVMSEQGWVTDDRDRPIYKPTRADQVKMALGLKPLDKSIREVEARFLREQETIDRKNRSRLIDDFLKASAEKDGARVQELAKELADAGVSPESIRAAAKNQNIEPQLRLLRSLSRPTRAREIERFVTEP